MSLVHNNEKLKDRRRELRKRSTRAEKILWLKVRGNKLGFKFKRQHSIGGYILDFYCSVKKLIIEIDGGSHNDPNAKVYDKNRDKYFSELGYNTARFTNAEVESDVESVLSKIKNHLIK